MYYTDQEILDFVIKIQNNECYKILSEERLKKQLEKIQENDLISILYSKDEKDQNDILVSRGLKIQYFIRICENIFTDDRVALDMKFAERNKITLDEYFKIKFNERIKGEKHRIKYLESHNIKEEYEEIGFSHFLKHLFTKTEIIE